MESKLSKIAQKTIDEAIEAKKKPAFDLEKFCFDKQLEFIRDPSPFKLAVCSRRAGKTVACAAHLIETAILNEDVVCLYITLSRKNAKKLIWKELKRINKAFSLGIHFDNTELSATFQNGSVIYVSGAKDESEIEKFRGLPIKLCYIDECQSFRPYLKDLIDEIIAPALMDYAGTLCLIGTPGPVPNGYFYECSEKLKSWSKHYWTFWDNPYIPLKSKKTHREVFERELKRREIDANHPSIQREWFGKWILDVESLLIRYNPEVNHYDQLPTGHNWIHITGIDLGLIECDALGTIAWAETTDEIYLVEEEVTPDQDITDLANQIKANMTKYSPVKLPTDEGALGKKIAEEIRRRFHIPLTPADKKRRLESVKFLNDYLRRGKFKAKKDSRFAQDSYLVEIDTEKSTPTRIVEKKGFHSDIIPAVLYAFKESPAFTYQAPTPKPKYGSKEWAEAQVSEMEQAALEHFQALEESAQGFGEWPS
jgi:hypothetical protein